MLGVDPSKHVLGIVAGAGEYPRLMIEGAKRAGMRVICAGMRGAVGADIPPLCDAFRKFRVGAIEAPLAFFKEHGVTHIVLTGQIKPACIYTMWPDATARQHLAKLDRRNAHTIFGAACDLLQQHGMQVLPSTAFMEEVLPQAGHLAGPPPTPKQLEEAAHGMQLAREIARLDIGQSLIVRGHRVTCVEAYKGTNECIKNGEGSAENPVTLCKVTKPGHDMRFDVPCIGVRTIEHCARCGVSHIVFEAGRTILFQQQKVIDMCNQHGITLHAMDIPQGGTTVEDLGATADDAAHATALANALEKLGIGHSAVVCEGVIIAVEDPHGPLKCIRRAAVYMKRIRFMRFTNWLIRILLGKNSTPPAPMVMRGSASFQPTPEVQRAAKKAGIQLS